MRAVRYHILLLLLSQGAGQWEGGGGQIKQVWEVGTPATPRCDIILPSLFCLFVFLLFFWEAGVEGMLNERLCPLIAAWEVPSVGGVVYLLLSAHTETRSSVCFVLLCFVCVIQVAQLTNVLQFIPGCANEMDYFFCKVSKTKTAGTLSGQTRSLP